MSKQTKRKGAIRERLREMTGYVRPPKSRDQKHEERRFRQIMRGRLTWELRLTEDIRHLRPLIDEYGFALPIDVSRLQRAAGNPYLNFWSAVDANDGNWMSEMMPPLFADRERMERVAAQMFPGRALFTPAVGDIHMATARMFAHLCRDYGTQFYAWAVPNGDALNVLANLNMPICELGSGRGYWAWLLERRGVRMLTEEPGAYDWYWRAPDRRTARALPRDHALFFCWPPYRDSWASRRLREYQGSTVIYVGEGAGGVTGNGAFHAQLAQWREETVIDIPQWDGIHDRLTIYRRRR